MLWYQVQYINEYKWMPYGEASTTKQEANKKFLDFLSLYQNSPEDWKALRIVTVRNNLILEVLDYKEPK